MRVQFTPREHGPERLVTDAEIIFDEGPLAGMKLVGFSVWSTPEGELSVTLPSRPFGAGGERRYFDFLRSAAADAADTRRVKAWILEQWALVERTKAAILAEVRGC